MTKRRRSLIVAAALILGLVACDDKPDNVELGPVDAAGFEEKTGEPWPLTVDGGTLFCRYQDVNLGEDFLLWIAVDGENYALNPTARFLLDDGNAKNWEAIWRRNADDTRYISLDPFDQYLTPECVEG